MLGISEVGDVEGVREGSSVDGDFEGVSLGSAVGTGMQ